MALALSRMPYLVWLDGGESGRFSYVAAAPVEIVEAQGDLEDPWSPLHRVAVTETESDLHVPEWIGFVSYEAGVPSAPGKTQDAAFPAPPAVHFARYPAVYVYDHETNEGAVVGETLEATDALVAGLADGVGQPSTAFRVDSLQSPDAAPHLQNIDRALDAIAAGEIYQINLARRWEAAFTGSPLGLFLAMRAASPVPLGAFIDFGAGQVLSRSMETFLRLDARTRVVQSRPIKGTVPRTTLAGEATTLRTSEKELAEHNMIVDLMRNDLGRVAEVGSVRVAEHLAIEQFAKLSHMVSTVEAKLAPAVTLGSLFRASFPPGSITGTPKRRAMQWIEALEPCPRGAYCGALGMLCRNGDAHFSVAIRTAQVASGHVVYHAGGGIVAASDPPAELAETELKARAFLDALERVTPGT